ncbi:hypothetical protein HHK36_015676 [Tetracentron sinense]|uniref:VWFA domain-containing protein n=1 Tax=Tetracentron sinense TaxID=13715 RepID=A0A834Z5D8_TETSI|nr:hypothetical protein HHK36_015676 [Tetracentron sinense]
MLSMMADSSLMPELRGFSEVRDSDFFAWRPVAEITLSTSALISITRLTNTLPISQVTTAFARTGLESSNLIVGIDFTKSNEWTGKYSFNRQSLHCIGHNQNPYEQAISTIGKTLSAFDKDDLIPCFGFGDESTHDQDVFSFYPNERFCNGFEEVLRRYREIVPELQLKEPTSFAPMIEMGMTIVEQSGGLFHVLLIIADGQVTRSPDFGTQRGQRSPQEQKTVEAIVKASEYPLSIILVGVGDGPWDMMKEFEDNIPARAFDNFQFVNFTKIMSKNVDLSRKQTEFALAALMKIPSQYKATLELNLLGSRSGTALDRVPLPPPLYGAAASSSSSKPLHSSSFQNSAPPDHEYDTTTGTAPHASSAFDNQIGDAQRGRQPKTTAGDGSKGGDNGEGQEMRRSVTDPLAHVGLKSSNLIVGIDFTKSNEWTGARSFNRQSLHHIGHGENPYEQAISIIGKTLSAFDGDNLIPCFGFGDASTHDQDVFSFYPGERFCNRFEEVLSRYREIVPELRLSGPTSFAPMIEMGMTIVEQSGGQYHVLLIISDGQRCQLSPQEQKTIKAIVKASEYPLSIIVVGVGDGPWDMMKEFNDTVPARAFDNFQFVNFTEIMSKNVDLSRKQTEFVLATLMEIPAQYKATLELNLLGSRKGKAPYRVPLPPPLCGAAASFSSSKPFHSSSFQKNAPPGHGYGITIGKAPPASSAFDNQVCPVCLSNPKDTAFGCGHQVFQHAVTVGKTFSHAPFAGSQSKPE